MAKRQKQSEPREEGTGELTPAELVDYLHEEMDNQSASSGGFVAPRAYISTQCAALDFGIGRPGIPTGGITNIYGDESSGKSTVSYHLLAETQSRDGIAILIDTEAAYDYDRGKRIGVNYDDLVILDPPTLEEAFDEIEAAIIKIRTRNPDRLALVVFDSIAGESTKASLEGSYADIHPADRARIVSGALPRLHQKALKGSNCALVLVNQLRAKIEMGPSWGGPKMTQVAENSLKFWSSLRIHFRAASAPITTDGRKESEAIGIEVVGEFKKNKIGPNFRKAQFAIKFWDGIDKAGSKLAVAVKVGLVTMGGGWYQIDGDKFRAKDWPEYLRTHPELDSLIAQAPLLWMVEDES
jgi:recombination protein RecA